jgi:cell wall-associated NlpC family hydrolase
MKNFIPAAILSLLFLASCATHIGGYRRGWFFNADDRIKIVRTAEQYLGVRYQKGGASPNGFDCSGYVMYVYMKNGVLLPRSVQAQYGVGRKISRDEMQTGDLVFYKTSRKKYSHVGIYIGDHRFIHAPRTGKRVSYADMDKSYWKKRYIGAVTFMQKNRL